METAIERVARRRACAESGDVQAQLNMGDLYRTGKVPGQEEEPSGVLPDLAASAEWYRRAAEQGNAGAQARLGECCRYGKGVPVNLVEAAVCFLKSARQGHPGGEYKFGLCLSLGIGVTQNPEKAVVFFRRSAAQGNTDAFVSLGDAYHTGEGVTRDPVQAAAWFRRGAEEGNPTAQLSLARCYCNDEGVTRDINQAVEWAHKAAATALGATWEVSSRAQFMLGRLCAMGEGVVQDLFRAARWYHKAARQGCAESQWQFGEILRIGELIGVDRLTKRGRMRGARKYIARAAVQGHAQAIERAIEMRRCHCCGAGDASRFCELCLVARYCGPECQRKHWNGRGGGGGDGGGGAEHEAHKRTCGRTHTHLSSITSGG